MTRFSLRIPIRSAGIGLLVLQEPCVGEHHVALHGLHTHPEALWGLEVGDGACRPPLKLYKCKPYGGYCSR